MNSEKIKVGEKYNIQVECTEISCGDVFIKIQKSEKAVGFYIPHLDAVKLLSPIPAAPKYDPCRRFKCGDKVRVVTWNGRNAIPKSYLKELGVDTFRVIDDENRGFVVIDICGESNTIPACFLELVTPVEELERYVVEPSDVAWFVVDKKHESGVQNVVMYMCALHPHAKEAAEAERDRLNAEHRKEQNNG